MAKLRWQHGEGKGEGGEVTNFLISIRVSMELGAIYYRFIVIPDKGFKPHCALLETR